MYYDPVTATMSITQTSKFSEIVDTINEATTKCQVANLFMHVCMYVGMYVCMYVYIGMYVCMCV